MRSEFMSTERYTNTERSNRKPKKCELLRPFYATHTTVNVPCIIVLLKSNGTDDYPNNPYKERYRATCQETRI